MLIQFKGVQKLKQSDLEKLYIINTNGIFTPLYSYESIENIKDENGAIVDYEYIGYQQIKTAQEVYAEWQQQQVNAINTVHIAEIKERLVQIDLESVRPLRAKVNNVATEEDNTKLINLETEATMLRAELAKLNI